MGDEEVGTFGTVTVLLLVGAAIFGAGYLTGEQAGRDSVDGFKKCIQVERSAELVHFRNTGQETSVEIIQEDRIVRKIDDFGRGDRLQIHPSRTVEVCLETFYNVSAGEVQVGTWKSGMKSGLEVETREFNEKIRAENKDSGGENQH
ncbi:hypothetical protein [Haloferax sp. Q22]|uniref:hypothetical protein n=1 Tax=Haloferax sp. (strain Q22) TaxID=1526048 RepID=UPI000B20463E|nr:hypothetical protein [Haloferax sp. Q22]